MYFRQYKKQSHESGDIIVGLVIILVLAVILALGWFVYVKYYRHPNPVVMLPSNCQASELDLSIGPSTGTAGTIYVDAVLTNQGQRTCTLNGYPTVSLVDTHNALLGIMAASNSAFPPTTITLHPGESAHAAMGFPEPANFGPGVCSAVSTNLKLVPPNLSTYLETPLTRQSCPGFSVTSIQSGL